ncbi:hypothetical protein BD410DRAFT_801424 [Rickenella mellea]|uniref:Uncharacterized protein n=1 Tax=Rickenella mellea TaxID=50990 RepID=A0A4Y7QDW9_9AGAM|nr:hypothetical protein BD410DRAFT_801424 [Rickenella mellea]
MWLSFCCTNGVAHDDEDEWYYTKRMSELLCGLTLCPPRHKRLRDLLQCREREPEGVSSMFGISIAGVPKTTVINYSQLVVYGLIGLEGDHDRAGLRFMILSQSRRKSEVRRVDAPSIFFEQRGFLTFHIFHNINKSTRGGPRIHAESQARVQSNIIVRARQCDRKSKWLETDYHAIN